jgi:hypothetical protein
MPETSFFLPLVLQSAVTPLFVALVLLAIGRTAWPRAAAVLALAGGFLASYAATLHAQWSPVPHVALDWLPYLVLASVFAACRVEKIASAVGRGVARLVAGAVLGAVVTWPALASLGAVKAATAVVAVALLVALAWTGMARPARGAVTRALLLAVVAGGAALTLMLDSSQSIGQLSGALASVLAACVVFGLPRLHVAFTPPAAGLAVLVLAALLANAQLYAGFSLGYVALLVAALLADPVLVGIGRLRRPGADGPGWIPAAVLTAVPVVVTIALAVKAAHDSGGY